MTATARCAAAARLRDVTRQCMYFETGQGSEFTYGKHNGIDMTTTEALCYGLARRYDPFMVNNVTGFIGPETHLDNFEMILANLQDHFMGKLLGLPMGMAPCFTLHSQITLEGQQMATQLLDRRRGQLLHGRGAEHRPHAGLLRHQRPRRSRRCAKCTTGSPPPSFWPGRSSAEFLRATTEGQVARGPRWGDPRQFCDSDESFQCSCCERRRRCMGLRPPGPGPTNRSADKRDCTRRSVARRCTRNSTCESLEELADFRLVSTEATDRQAHLNHPELGSRLSAADLARLQPEGNQVQIVVSDGLSAEAAHDNLPSLLGVLGDALAARKIRVGRPMLARYARVKLAEPIAAAVRGRTGRAPVGRATRRRCPGGPQPVGLPGLSPRRCRPGSDAGSIERSLRIHGRLQHPRRRTAAAGSRAP